MLIRLTGWFDQNFRMALKGIVVGLLVYFSHMNVKSHPANAIRKKIIRWATVAEIKRIRKRTGRSKRNRQKKKV